MEHQVIDSHPELDQRPWKEIVADVIRDIEKIVQNELRLAGFELKEKLTQGGLAAGILAGAGLLGFFSMACMVTACIVALNIVMPLWLAAVVMGVLLATGAGGAFIMGRMMLQQVDPVPRKTMETLKDNVEWAKNRSRS